MAANGFTISNMFSAALLVVGAASLVLGVMLVLGHRRTRSADRQVRETWDGYMAETPSTLPEWDGETYDWPETGLVRYLESVSTTAPQPVWPVPVSDISGPLPTQPVEPEYDPAADAEAYIKSMTADTTAFIARIGADE
jgi:hypothetical protein